MPFVPTEISIDKAGRIVVPKEIRDRMGLLPGDNLTIDSDGDQLTLRPVREEPIMKKEHGIWVYQGSIRNFDIVKHIDDQREQRSLELLRGYVDDEPEQSGPEKD